MSPFVIIRFFCRLFTYNEHFSRDCNNPHISVLYSQVQVQM